MVYQLSEEGALTTKLHSMKRTWRFNRDKDIKLLFTTLSSNWSDRRGI